MTGEHLIEFEPGEVIKPKYNPENDLVGVNVNDAGLESLREAVCPDEPSGSSGDEPNNGPDMADAGPLDSAVLDIGMAVIELNAYVPEEMRER